MFLTLWLLAWKESKFVWIRKIKATYVSLGMLCLHIFLVLIYSRIRLALLGLRSGINHSRSYYIEILTFSSYGNAVPVWYLENTFPENEFDAWDWFEENCWEDEWRIWCRAQGILIFWSWYFESSLSVRVYIVLHQLL